MRWERLPNLRSRPNLDGTRIGVMGWSMGGAAAWLASDKSAVDAAALPQGGFRAAIGFYPARCSKVAPVNALANPILVLMGAADTIAGIAECEASVHRLAAAGNPIAAETYADSTHEFDNSHIAKPSQGFAAGIHFMMLYNADATAKAAKRLDEFLRDTMHQ